MDEPPHIGGMNIGTESPVKLRMQLSQGGLAFGVNPLANPLLVRFELAVAAMVVERFRRKRACRPFQFNNAVDELDRYAEMGGRRTVTMTCINVSDNAREVQWGMGCALAIPLLSSIMNHMRKKNGTPYLTNRSIR